MIKINLKKNIVSYILCCILFICAVISLSFYVINSKKRFVFLYPNVENDKLVIENRFFKKYDKKITDLSANDYYLTKYVDDLLLGSTKDRTKLLFKLGTKVEDCFLRDGILYLNLSDDLLLVTNESVDIKTGVDLLVKNIEKNFKKVKKIELFVNGIYAFEEL